MREFTFHQYKLRNEDEIASPFSGEECKLQFASVAPQAEACIPSGEVISSLILNQKKRAEYQVVENDNKRFYPGSALTPMGKIYDRDKKITYR